MSAQPNSAVESGGEPHSIKWTARPNARGGSHGPPFTTSLAIMKPSLALGLAILSFGQAVACERNLVGTWKSDGETSMAFIRDNTKLRPKTEAFLAALLGHMTLSFTATELHLVMPDVEVPVSGQLRPFAGFEERKPYKVLFCSESMIVWSAKRPFGDGDSATVFQFVGPDTVWVYTGSVEPGVPDLHAREYFQRVR